jgi:hypothetical protein
VRRETINLLALLTNRPAYQRHRRGNENDRDCNLDPGYGAGDRARTSRQIMDPRIKKTLLVAFAAGVGFAVAIAALAGGTYWYLSRPKPPKPWNTTAIVASGTPSFEVIENGEKVRLTFSLENNTPYDYRVTSGEDIKLLRSFSRDNTLSQPVAPETASITFPIFIPAKQKAEVAVAINFIEIPKQKTTETADQYHETLRAYVLNQMRGDASIFIFDETNRYQISLPKPASQAPAKTPSSL